MIKKCCLIYAANNQKFFGEVRIHFFAPNPRLSKYEIVDVNRVDFDPIALIKTYQLKKDYLVRYCTDYHLGVRIKEFITTEDIKPITLPMEYKVYSLGEQWEYCDRVFENFEYDNLGFQT